MNRRDLIKQILGVSSVGFSLNVGQLLSAELKAKGQRLILLELSGANDGLNTLVPYQNDHYYRLRPKLALSESGLISLDEEFALHEKLRPLMQLWQQSELAWVQGLGYPRPNRSHFKSIALWETGGDGQADGSDGWLTHDIEHNIGRHIADAHGISLVDDMALFNSPSGRWLSTKSTGQLLSAEYKPVANQGYSNALIKKLEQQSSELETMLASLSHKLDKVKEVRRMPKSGLGRQLSEVIRFIRAGLDTPIYRVQLGGFDTHENQLGRHAQLLTELSKAVVATRDNLKRDGEWQNTLIMSYSEFGRRAEENLSGGTDHGTAAPHFLAGGAVSGGLYGQAPDLSNLIDGDPAYTMDYRAVYQQVLSWFGAHDNRFVDYRANELKSLFT